MTGSESLIFVAGGRGQGKSTYVKNLIRKRPRVIVFDVMQEYHLEKGYTLVTSIKQLQGVMRKKAYKVAFQPNTQERAPEVWLHVLSGFLFRYQDWYISKGKVPPALTLVVEEMSKSAPNEKQVKDNRNFDEMIDRGRHKEIEVIGVTQRVTKAKKDFVENAEEYIFFRIGFRDAKMVESAYLSPEWHGKIGKLPVHHYIKINGFDVKTGKNTLKKRL